MRKPKSFWIASTIGVAGMLTPLACNAHGVVEARDMQIQNAYPLITAPAETQASLIRQSLQEAMLQDWHLQATKFAGMRNPMAALDAFFAAPPRCLYEHLLPCPPGYQSINPFKQPAQFQDKR